MNLLTVIGVTDWMFKMIRSLFITIDRVVYAWIENCYELLIKLSESGIFSQSTIQEFANRIYVFLGLIMIFRVSITLVQYIINPQNFNDKAIGGAALVKNVAFVLVGIVLQTRDEDDQQDFINFFYANRDIICIYYISS